MRVINRTNATAQELLGRENSTVLVQSIGFAEYETRIDTVEILIDGVQRCLFDE